MSLSPNNSQHKHSSPLNFNLKHQITTMASNLKTVCVTMLIFSLVSLAHVKQTGAAGGACGRTPINSAAASLAPCLGAAQNLRVRVPPVCCARVGALLRTSPKCLCAVLLSPLASKSGIKPGIAITVPKRCNIRNRPAGKKCGRYTLP